MRRDRADLLLDSVQEVARSKRGLELAGASAADRSATLGRVVESLVAAGELPGRHGEMYAVSTDFGVEPLATLDRAAVSWFGVPAYGVHLNGFVRRADGLWMWVAVRSRSKPNFPGMLDNMVAGGQPVGISARDNMRKECAEEASMPDEIARCARPVGAISYCVEHERGLKPDTMFCYDLELTDSFVPRSNDGEVESFELWPIARVAETVSETTRFKFNCNLVIIDFLVRHGILGPDDPDYVAITNGLRRLVGARP